MASEPGDDAGSSFEVELARTRALEADFLNLSLPEAEKLAEQLGVELRVIDSETTALTADLHSRRITVDVRSGTVSDATAG